MDFVTPLFRLFSRRRLAAISLYSCSPELIQANQLRRIIGQLSRTTYGKRYGVDSRAGYQEFISSLPVVSYEDLSPFIHSMLEGEADVLLPGRCLWYAKSSGTTDYKSKFLPLPDTHLRQCHYRGGMDCVRIYLNQHPKSHFFTHKGYSLTGTFDSIPESFAHDVRVGDLSAILIERLPSIGQLVRTPSKSLLLLPDWEEKKDRISSYLITEDLGNLSGIPSWLSLVLEETLKKSGASHLTELWPNLEVYFHGGIAFHPYREKFRCLLGPDVFFLETYNASEGFFGIQDDPSDPSLLLMLDYGVYYELIPMSDYLSGNYTAIPLSQAKIGIQYALVISTLGGLYRYLIGDTIQFTSLCPYKFLLTGRTRAFINAFGEEVMVSNTDMAISRTSAFFGVQVIEYTVGPVFYQNPLGGAHHWVIEIEGEEQDASLWAEMIDKELISCNTDYEAKRKEGSYMRMPIVDFVPRGTFYRWMSYRNHLGGQHKVPRLSSDSDIVNQLLKIAKER